MGRLELAKRHTTHLGVGDSHFPRGCHEEDGQTDRRSV